MLGINVLRGLNIILTEVFTSSAKPNQRQYIGIFF